MSWRVMGAGHYPFGFVDPPEHLTVENDITHETVRYLPERTCRIDGGECTYCGAYISEDACRYWEPTGKGLETIEKRDVLFCPRCGAKVVEQMEGLKLIIDDQITGFCPSCPDPDLYISFESGGGKGESYDEVRYKVSCTHVKVCKYRDRAKSAKVVE